MEKRSLKNNKNQIITLNFYEMEEMVTLFLPFFIYFPYFCLCNTKMLNKNEILTTRKRQKFGKK